MERGMSSSFIDSFQFYRQLPVFRGVTLWLWVVLPSCLRSGSPLCLDSFVTTTMALQFETSGFGYPMMQCSIAEGLDPQ